MKKSLLIGAVAVLAAAGALVAALLSSSGGGSSAGRASSGTTAPSASVSSSTETATGSGGAPPPPSSIVPTTTAAIPPPPGPHSQRRRSFTVGTVDDSLAQADPASAQSRVDVSHHAGFGAVVISAGWKRGRTRPSARLVHGIHNVAVAAVRDHMKLFLVVWNGLAPDTPRTSEERREFASFAAALSKAVPHARGMIVGNEPNLNTFWTPQFGPGGRDAAAIGYEDLLARSYDAIKAVSPHMQVIGVALSPRGADRPHGIRPTHSPTAFIRDLGRAYRASGRDTPLMDAFALHPYMLKSRIPPNLAHPKTTQITLGDYPKLVTLLDEAFRGTPQRGRTLPIFYTEFGVQTSVPDTKASAYQEGTFTSEPGVSAATQAAYYREAIALAYCQPTVRGLFILHTFDESNLDGWQSGLYYADGTPKPSVGGFHRAVVDLRHGKLTTCGR